MGRFRVPSPGPRPVLEETILKAQFGPVREVGVWFWLYACRLLDSCFNDRDWQDPRGNYFGESLVMGMVAGNLVTGSAF